MPAPSPLSGSDTTSLRVLMGGILGMVAVMGIGRFVYTPLLPLMQRDLGLSHTTAGWLAGWNYVGYLAGAVGCSIWPRGLRHPPVNAVALALNIATTAAMGLTTDVAAWSVLRLVSGVTSAMVFIIISAEVAQTLARRGRGAWSGLLYSGIGLGIVLSGLLTPPLDRFTNWSGCWIGMGALAGGLAGIGLWLGRDRESIRPPPGPAPPAAGLPRIRVMSAAYFLEGLGYVVTATFLVAIIAATPGLKSVAPYTWVVVGLAAIPATTLWPHVAARFGPRSALLAAYGVQAAGILLSIRARTVPAALISAAAFGATFLGIVALILAEGQRRAPSDSRRVAAVLTAWFGLGQALGPIAAGTLADRRHGFDLPLSLAAASILAGALLIAVDPGFQPQSTPNGDTSCPT